PIPRSPFPLLSLQTLISAMDAAPEQLRPLSTTTASPDTPADGRDTSPKADANDDVKYGFRRAEMYQSPLSGTVHPYDCHLFLCYKNPQSWPSRIESSESDRLPRLLAAALKSRKSEIPRGVGGSLSMMPLLLRIRIGENSIIADPTPPFVVDYIIGSIRLDITADSREPMGLTHFDVDNFVDDVLVKGKEWNSRKAEKLTGSHVFVCSHASRDRRCGVCGPVLIKKFEEEIELRGMKNQVFVSPCSHVGGHKYAGNLILFSLNSCGEVVGHWYGYVTPDDVPILIDEQIVKGGVVSQLWRYSFVNYEKYLAPNALVRLQSGRGQMGSAKPEQEKEINSEGSSTKKVEKEADGSSQGIEKDGMSCCQGANGFSCCRDEKVGSDTKVVTGNNCEQGRGADTKSTSKDNSWVATSWFKTWDQADTLAALAVVGAAASVAVAYSIYRRRVALNLSALCRVYSPDYEEQL
ncbi:hypothetical protein ACLOJK_008338, partial [Asimina triloba]